MGDAARWQENENPMKDKMRLLVCFNMANDGWSVVKGLRALGEDAHLMLHRPAHVASLPQWEEAEIDVGKLGTDMNNPDWEALNERWKMPDYVHVWDMRRSWYPFSRTIRSPFQLMQLAKYDIIIGHTPFASFVPFYRLLRDNPYIIYDAGWIRYLHDANFPQCDSKAYRRAREGYKNAATIFFTNVDTYDLFRSYGYPRDQLTYTPFAIDMELYKPYVANPNAVLVPQLLKKHDMVFFAPSRQNWKEKGNDRIIQAFARYINEGKRALLVMIEWAQKPNIIDKYDYMHLAREMIKELRIEDSVLWLPVMSKRELIKWYSLSDVVLDQFVFGALGTTTPEAMSCAKPVITYVEPGMWERCHGSVPPVANAHSSDDIYNKMVELEDAATREEYGKRGREWIKKHCEMKLVADFQRQICREVISQWKK